MLRSLAIRDIVLIERLELETGPGLAVLTGETGAGKSIVLDALGLALGARADRGLVRAGAPQGSVVALFDAPSDHPALQLLAANELGCEGEIVLRRVVTADGRSRAFINDVPVGTGLLRSLGDLLVEIHGQFEQRGLLDPREHRALLDAFGGLIPALERCRAAHAARAAARHRRQTLAAEVEAVRREEELLRHRERELADLAVQPGEEDELAGHRQEQQSRDKLVAALQDALAAATGALERLGAGQRRLDRSAGLAPDLLAPPAEALERALVEVGEAEAAVEATLRHLEGDGGDLERVEERLFALRDAARKYRVAVEALPDLLEETRRLLEGIDRGADQLAAAETVAIQADAAYGAEAEALSADRARVAGDLARAVAAELPPLKLERARFQVAVERLALDEGGADGIDRVRFEVATNPGQPFGPLIKIASGGELSRFMLALKVVLARLDAVPTLIFDEVDAGIGGATADAVGERLARLGAERQVLVVTHAPQVAARADHHFTVRKDELLGHTSVAVHELDAAQRRDEIARMLAGAEVTDAARAAAASLMRVS